MYAETAVILLHGPEFTRLREFEYTGGLSKV